MKLILGIPTIKQYETSLQSKEFKALESYSDSFIIKNKRLITKYFNKWVKDPLRHWSRQWEYLFVYSSIIAYAKKNKKIKVLDAGSGITFFPYLLLTSVKNAQIVCYDYDESLRSMFSLVNKNLKKSIQFTTGDIRSLPFKDNTFDVIYCVSVLEHTGEYETIIKEFHRVLKTGGILIVTFDVSIDRTADISPEKSKELLKLLNKYFPVKKPNQMYSLLNKYKSKDVITTHYFKKHNPSLLPWRYPLLTMAKSLLKFRLQKSLIKHLTFFCFVFQKQQQK